MGLDQWAYSTPRKIPPVDFALDRSEDQEIMYWRKHPNLHGWMEVLYVSKGGTNEDFNMDTVQVTSEDLDALEKALDGKELPETTGFFFGKSLPEDEALDRAFIVKAREAIAAGLRVYYTSWW